MYGKTMNQTERNMHENHRNTIYTPVYIYIYREREKSKDILNKSTKCNQITETQRKSKETKNISGKQRNL